MKSILDRSFQYTPSAKTDLKKTFARIRREQREADQRQAANDTEAAEKVAQLPARKATP